MTSSRIRKGLRIVGLCVSAVVVIAAAAVLADQYRIRLSNDWQRYESLEPAAQPSSGDSIVVFAPHCDDETLGCGGVITVATKNDARVRVVVLTNGDGYRLAVGTTYRTLRVTPDECLRFAYERQEETLKAVSVLGLSESQVTFLGYPDRGLSRLWSTNWTPDQPYVSKATRWDRSPYRNSLTPGAIYCGESLVQDIVGVLARDKPTDVYIPHPSDNHPDHYATYCFVLAAIEQVKSESGVRAPKVHTYLVHRGDWPAPRGDHLAWSLAPPSALANGGTRWRTLRLAREIADDKREAILCYKSQLSIEDSFLMSFARSNEIQGGVPVRRIVRVPRGSMRVDGDPEDWLGIPPCVIDPVNDRVVANVTRSGDVRSVYVCADPDRLYLRVDCVGKCSKRITYVLGFRGIGDFGISDNCTVKVRPPDHCTYGSGSVAFDRNVMEMSLPRAEFKFSEDVFVQVTTRLSRLTVDNTGWRAVEFSRS